MTQLRTLQFFSGTLPGGETVTLHTGNARVFEADDAAWLLAEYPDRFAIVEVTNAPALSTDNDTQPDEPASAPQPKRKKS